jgi:L-2-hydroxyglutarate oxidase LhgO
MYCPHNLSATSSRNSEVIHAGIYYPEDSLKAKFCVQGKKLLYEFCDSHNITYNNCGKILVATNRQQLDQNLPLLQRKSMKNGVLDTELISREDVKFLEPDVECMGALLSPSTGVVDSHSFFLGLQGDAEDHGAALSLNTTVDDAEIVDGKVFLHADDTWIECDSVINSAGLWAHKTAAMIHNSHHWKPPAHYFAKGTYFRLQGKPPFSRLVYPVPENGGLGVHATVDWSGLSVKFGPDVEWLEPGIDPDDVSLNPNVQRGDKFYDAVRNYWPGLPDGKLVPDYVGIRPKLSHPSLPDTGVGSVDFQIVGAKSHGVSGLIHLFGIESPGLTSSMAIGKYIRGVLND